MRLQLQEFTIREARTVYAWSRMRFADEVRDMCSAKAMHFVDMLEALLRTSSMKWWPTEQELQKQRACAAAAAAAARLAFYSFPHALALWTALFTRLDTR